MIKFIVGLFWLMIITYLLILAFAYNKYRKNENVSNVSVLLVFSFILILIIYSLVYVVVHLSHGL